MQHSDPQDAHQIPFPTIGPALYKAGVNTLAKRKSNQRKMSGIGEKNYIPEPIKQQKNSYLGPKSRQLILKQTNGWVESRHGTYLETEG